jgi:hypothetical protein
MMRGKLSRVFVLIAFLLAGCRTSPVNKRPTPHHTPKPAPIARPTANASESEIRKSLLKRIAGLNESQAEDVLSGVGIPVESGISAKFTLAKTANKADLPTLKNIAAHMP